MKKLLIALALLPALAFAHGGRGEYHEHHEYHERGNWLWPALIGGMIVYDLTAPPPVYHEAPPVIAQPSGAPYAFYCPTTQQYYPYVPACDVPWLKVVR